MTVSELIEELKKLPQDASVEVTSEVCCGCAPYDAGYVEVTDRGTVFIGN